MGQKGHIAVDQRPVGMQAHDAATRLIKASVACVANQLHSGLLEIGGGLKLIHRCFGMAPQKDLDLAGDSVGVALDRPFSRQSQMALCVAVQFNINQWRRFRQRRFSVLFFQWDTPKRTPLKK